MEQLKDNLRSTDHKNYLIDTPSLVELKKQWSVDDRIARSTKEFDCRSGFSSDITSQHFQFTNYQKLVVIIVIEIILIAILVRKLRDNRWKDSCNIIGRIIYLITIAQKFHTIDKLSRSDMIGNKTNNLRYMQCLFIESESGSMNPHVDLDEIEIDIGKDENKIRNCVSVTKNLNKNELNNAVNVENQEWILMMTMA